MTNHSTTIVVAVPLSQGETTRLHIGTTLKAPLFTFVVPAVLFTIPPNYTTNACAGTPVPKYEGTTGEEGVNCDKKNSKVSRAP